MKTTIFEFLDYCHLEKRLVEKTIKDYKKDLNQF